VAPSLVDVKARLADSIPGIDIKGLPLSEFLSTVSALSTIPITLDLDAVHDVGQSAAAPVQLHLNNVSVADAIQAAIEPLGLGYEVRDGQLIVGYPLQEKLRQVRYTVTDLVGSDTQALGDLAALVEQMVSPASWQAVGGKATLVAGKNGVLLIEQTESAHAQILDLCERLRVARGLPLKSSYDPARFVLTSREDAAQELLHKSISANFLTPQPLSQVMKWLSQATGATIVINHAALAQEGLSAESECSAVAVNGPLEKLLDDLTASADLTWRAIDGRTVEITSRPAALERMDVEFYPARNLAANPAAGEKLIAQIKANLDPQLWSAGSNQAVVNNGAEPGAIQLDQPSGTVIVRAPQRVQAQVEIFLAKVREKK
jgi:hypothetical protein